MKRDFDPAIPIYTQIVAEFKRRIFSRELLPGQKVPPVRELALELGVNPNTLQRAMSELEREGLLYTERTAGRFVTTDGELITSLRDSLIATVVQSFLAELDALGCTQQEVADLLQRYGGECDVRNSVKG